MSLAFSESEKEWEQGMQVAEAIKSARESEATAVIEEKQSEEDMTSGRDRQWDDADLSEDRKVIAEAKAEAARELEEFREQRINLEAAIRLRDVIRLQEEKDPEYAATLKDVLSYGEIKEAKKQKDVILGEGLNLDRCLPTNAEPGMKFDSSKPDMRLIPPLAELEMAKVLTFGAEKYAPGNWKKIEPERYVSAAMRHINAIRQGELVDSESGCHHAAHLMCCAAFMVELMKPSVSSLSALAIWRKTLPWV